MKYCDPYNILRTHRRRQIHLKSIIKMLVFILHAIAQLSKNKHLYLQFVITGKRLYDMLQLKCKPYAKPIFCNKCTERSKVRYWTHKTNGTWTVWLRFKHIPSYRGLWYILIVCNWTAMIICSYLMAPMRSDNIR